MNRRVCLTLQSDWQDGRESLVCSSLKILYYYMTCLIDGFKYNISIALFPCRINIIIMVCLYIMVRRVKTYP
jgi:hypothetical protein